MKLSSFFLLLAGSIALAHSLPAQSLVTIPEPEPPIIEESRPKEPPTATFLQLTQPVPPPVVSQSQLDLPDQRAIEDGYRAEIKLLAQKKHQFVRCKLKNGKVITGSLRAPGYEAFTLHTHILSDGHYIYYKDLAESPRAVQAVGTRFKQGMEWTGFGVLIAAALPIFIITSPIWFANGVRC